MFFIVKTIHSCLKLLNSETSPAQLAAGISFGLLMGFIPLVSLTALVLFLIVCFFRVNLSVFFLSLGIFSLLAFPMDPVFDAMGYWLLVDIGFLRPLWIKLSSGPIVPFFHFNNTIMTGSLSIGLFLWIPLFAGSRIFIIRYREKWKDRMNASPFVKLLKTTPLYGLYTKYQSFKAKFSLT